VGASLPDDIAISDEEIRLQRERFEFDKLKAENDFALRRRELDIRERELNQKASEDQRAKWQNPLMLAIRFIILDGAICYQLGSSINTLGSKATLIDRKSNTVRDKILSEFTGLWPKAVPLETGKARGF
jgi:hypothetical protein